VNFGEVLPHFGHLNMSAIVCTPSRHRGP
jgi:hypothetical protein